jgi:hypothetical protein
VTAPARAPQRTWTAAEVLSLGVRTDLVTACQIVYGCGKNRAWELYHAGRLDFPALRCGRRVIVPVLPLLQLLGIASDGSAAGSATDPARANDSLGANREPHRTRF